MSDAAVVFSPASPAGNRVLFGDASSFSTPPTISEINASSDWNQVIALYNRRQSQIYDVPAPLTYLDASTLIPAAAINDLRTAINSLRASVGLSAVSFGATLTAGTRIQATHLTDIRTALAALVNPFTIPFTVKTRVYVRDDSPTFGSFSSDRDFLSSLGVSGCTPNTDFLGLQRGLNGFPLTEWFRIRAGVSLSIPVALNASATANFRFVGGVPGGGTTVVNLYLSNTDDHAYSSVAWAGHLDTLESSLSFSSSGNHDMSVSMGDLNAHAGSYASLVLAQQGDSTGVQNFQDTTVTAHPVLIVDFGF